MSRLASEADFEQGGLYDRYQRYSFFATRANELKTRFPTPGKILIAGCGWGYLVDELVQAGFDAWGCDASSYAVQKAAAVLPAASAARVLQADCLNRQQLSDLRTAAGLSGNQKFGVIVTEDCLPVCSDAEVTTLLGELRRIGTTLFHIITCSKADDPPGRRIATDLNWKLQSAWKTVVGGELVYDTETGIVL